MSAQGMTRTVLATGLQQALAKDAAAGRIGFVAHEFGPNVQAWLREVAQTVVEAPATRADARKVPALSVEEIVAIDPHSARSGEAARSQLALTASRAVEAAARKWGLELVADGEECERPVRGEFTGDAAKLAEAIARAAQTAGIYNGQVSLTGPHLLMLLDDMAQGYARMAAPTEVPAAGSRTPADYAMEHGEYLAAGAEQLLKAIAEEQQLAMDLEEVEALSQEQEAAMSQAHEATTEATRNLRSDIYEFRKRHKRALAAAQDQNGGEQNSPERVTERG